MGVQKLKQSEEVQAYQALKKWQKTNLRKAPRGMDLALTAASTDLDFCSLFG
jgi:hypothetical protein